MNSDLNHTRYTGRFAPSPTGPLHFGSLIAATASYLEARAHQGRWLVRMEDLDQAREMPGAADIILETLGRYGFEWDGDVLYQSQQTALYQQVLQQLEQQQFAYPCGCTRKEIQATGHPGLDGIIYPGHCRQGLNGKTARAWRVRVDQTAIQFEDLLQGRQVQQLDTAVGDFVLKRADGFFAYQLAVVIDDALQGITHIIRGADLLDSTPRQIYLQRLLGLNPPVYGHLPVATHANGDKLSKQTQAPAITDADPVATLFAVLQFLGQPPPATLKTAPLADFWHWAIAHWQLAKVPRTTQITVSSG